MEKLTPKHNHTLTDILKVAIFGLILIMPFLVYSPTALYYGFNEHATSQTTITEGGWQVQNKYETNEVNSVDDLVLGNVYQWAEFELRPDEGGKYTLEILNIEGSQFLNEIPNYVDEVVFNYDMNFKNTYVELIYDGDIGETISIFIYLDYDNDDYLSYNFDNYFSGDYLTFRIIDGLNVFKQKYSQEVNTHRITDSNYEELEYVWNDETEVTKDITQMMYQNWQEMWTTPLFNWTNTSILKQGLDNFTGVFGITNTSCYTNLIAYELIFVAIYIVIDIVLKMFEWLTHMIGNK